jgi:hypothetical protein
MLTASQNQVSAHREPSLLGLSPRFDRLQCHHVAAAVRTGRHANKRVDQVGAVLHEPGFTEQRHSGVPANPPQLPWRTRRTVRAAAHVELAPRNPAPEPPCSVHQLRRPLVELSPRLPRQGSQSLHVLARRRTPAFTAIRSQSTSAAPAASSLLRLTRARPRIQQRRQRWHPARRRGLLLWL